MGSKTPEEITAGLSEAQRKAVLRATHSPRLSAWHIEGWYLSGDKRVRYNLCRAGLTFDYLRPSNRLSPLGLAVRAILQSQVTGHD